MSLLWSYYENKIGPYKRYASAVMYREEATPFWTSNVVSFTYICSLKVTCEYEVINFSLMIFWNFQGLTAPWPRWLRMPVNSTHDDQAYQAFLNVPSCRRTTDELCLAAASARSTTSCSRLSGRLSCDIDRGSHPPLGICHVSLGAMKPTNN